MDRPRDECGIFAVSNYSGRSTAAQIVFLGLLALQHRGQESAGIAYACPGGLSSHRGMGLVSRVFTRELTASIPARSVLGHVRYSTTGLSSINNAQPLLARSSRGYSIALAHNGNLSNNELLKKSMLDEGHIFHTSTDTETILAYLFRHRSLGLVKAAAETMGLVEGAYAVVLMDGEEMAAFRDSYGFRPLVIGRLDDAYIFSSESCALDAVGAELVREVLPGEIVSLRQGKMESYHPRVSPCTAFCVFEFIYFARPDSSFSGKNVHMVRKALGFRLARRLASKVDMVIPSPDSGISAAIGMAEYAGLPLEWAIHRNPYLGRTFIEPVSGRKLAAQLKYSPVGDLVRGKKVAVVDDSLVRGTTASKLTALLRDAGAAEVHLYITAPPYRYPCYYGIDIPVAAELAVTNEELTGLAAAVGADSLTFASLDDLYAAIGGGGDGFCSACFTGCYPTDHLTERKVG